MRAPILIRPLAEGEALPRGMVSISVMGGMFREPAGEPIIVTAMADVPALFIKKGERLIFTPQGAWDCDATYRPSISRRHGGVPTDQGAEVSS